MILMTLPWPPTANTYYRAVPGEGVKISADGRSYRKAVADCVLVQRGAKLLAGRLGVRILAYPPDARRRDMDNLLKPLLDALTHNGCWLDDEQIDDLRIIRAEKFKGGRVSVEVWELGVLRGTT